MVRRGGAAPEFLDGAMNGHRTGWQRVVHGFPVSPNEAGGSVACHRNPGGDADSATESSRSAVIDTVGLGVGQHRFGEVRCGVAIARLPQASLNLVGGDGGQQSISGRLSPSSSGLGAKLWWRYGWRGISEIGPHSWSR